MAIKYFSNVTRKTYDSEEDAIREEKIFNEKIDSENKKRKEKEKRLEEIENARKEAFAAMIKLEELLKAYEKDFNNDESMEEEQLFDFLSFLKNLI